MPSDDQLMQQMMKTVLNPSLAKQTGEANAVQVAALSCAAVVTDASQFVQAVTVVSGAAIGTFTAGMVAQVVSTGDPNSPYKFEDAMKAVQTNVQDTATTFEKVGEAAAAVLSKWKAL
jgi:hypothetical protein